MQEYNSVHNDQIYMINIQLQYSSNVCGRVWNKSPKLHLIYQKYEYCEILFQFKKTAFFVNIS